MNNIIRISLVLIVLSNALTVKSQSLPETQLTLSYFGHLLIQPGVKLGAEFPLKHSEVLKGERQISKRLIFGPQIAFFSRVGINNNLMLNADIGYQRNKQLSKNYSVYGIGLGYLNQSEIQSFTVDLNNGDVGDDSRVNTGYFLPTAYYTFGHRVKEHWGWYVKLAYGIRVNPNEESSGMLFTEFGVKVSLSKKSSE